MLSERLKPARAERQERGGAESQGAKPDSADGLFDGRPEAGDGNVRVGYVYLAINTEPGGAACVKVGRTNSPMRRVSEYRRVSPGTEFLRVAGPYKNCHDVERLLIRRFRETLGTPVRGREYFTSSGDLGYGREVSLFTGFCHDEVGGALGIPVPMEVD